MSDPKKPELNKDFKISQQEAAQQKTREQEMNEKLKSKQKAAEEQRLQRIEAIKDDKTRQDLKLKIAKADKDAADQLDRLKQQQNEKVNREVAKRANSLSNRALTVTGMAGKSQNRIQDEVKAQFKADHQKEQASCVQFAHDVSRKSVDKEVQQAVAKEQLREVQRKQHIKSRSPEQVFEKPAEERTSKDAFTQAHDRNDETKSWRQLRDERQAEERER